jgi:hypothetical protein
MKVDFKTFPISTHGPQITLGVMRYGHLNLALPGGPNCHGPNWMPSGPNSPSELVARRSELTFLSLLLSLQSGSCPKFLIIELPCSISNQWSLLSTRHGCINGSDVLIIPPSCI